MAKRKRSPVAFIVDTDKNSVTININEDSPFDTLPCTCGSVFKKAKATLFFWESIGEEFEYCECKSLPIALIESGMFPLSPTKPVGAVHFEVCNLIINARNAFAASGEKLAEIFNLQHQDDKKERSLSGLAVSNLILSYNKMIELASQSIQEAVITCPACPKATSKDPNDMEYRMFDGNFQLKGKKGYEEDLASAKVDGLKGCETMWLKEKFVQQFASVTSGRAPFEPRHFKALVGQNKTSALYPVRGVFGSG